MRRCCSYSIHTRYRRLESDEKESERRQNEVDVMTRDLMSFLRKERGRLHVRRVQHIVSVLGLTLINPECLCRSL